MHAFGSFSFSDCIFRDQMLRCCHLSHATCPVNLDYVTSNAFEPKSIGTKFTIWHPISFKLVHSDMLHGEEFVTDLAVYKYLPRNTFRKIVMGNRRLIFPYLDLFFQSKFGEFLKLGSHHFVFIQLITTRLIASLCAFRIRERFLLSPSASISATFLVPRNIME